MAERLSEFDRAMKYALREVGRVGGDPDKLSPPVRIAVLVYAAQGIIENGCLKYFFEANFPKKPPYSIFVEAYRTIGAVDEAEALAEAVDLFPFPDPQRFAKRRNKYMEIFEDSDGCQRRDSPFRSLTNRMCENERVWRLLEAYVRRHAESFSI